MGDIDAYQLPDAKGYAAFSRCAALVCLCVEGRLFSCWCFFLCGCCFVFVCVVSHNTHTAPSSHPNTTSNQIKQTSYLLGVTDEERQKRREQVLGTTAKDFRDFADALDAVAGPAARVVAVTSADKAAAVNEERPGFWEVKKVL
jgi:hypothetical protein